jgi:deazaflavin-dependent oxidoreductase (nitroreductase family)
MGKYGDYTRWMYRHGRPNAWARWQNRASASMFAAGLWPRRAAALEVRGRKSGRVITFPIVIADHDGERYLVSMLGQNVNWVRNVRAADGQAVLRHGKTEAIRLVEVPPEARAPIVRRYMQVAPSGRQHIPVDRHAPLEEFEKVAPTIPVFRITSRAPANAA